MGKLDSFQEEVLAAVAAGETYAEIGKRFGVSSRTVSDFCKKHRVASKRARHLQTRRKDGYLQEEQAQVMQLLDAGVKATEIAKRLGCSLPWIYVVGRKLGHEFNGLSIIPEHGAEILALARAGENFKAIAERFGVSDTTISDYCRKNGVESAWKGYNQYGNYAQRLDRAKDVIAKHAPGFEYYNGFTDTDSPVVLRCKTCGAIKQSHMGSVRAGKVRCDVCWSLERTKARAAKEQAREDQRIEVKRARILKQMKGATQLSFQFCVCGASLGTSRSTRCVACA